MPTPTVLLDGAFRLIVFDWDGTAVEHRHADATRVRRIAERLLRAEVLLVVVTGTNVANVEAQFSSAIRGPQKSNLYLCTNRGSEVYGYSGPSPPMLRHLRRATGEEDRKLTEIAEALRDEIAARTGLVTEVIADRLNRRKIDLIPTPEWRDPPKSAMPELLAAVEARLRGAGLAGGLREVFEMTERLCRDRGLPDARVTSDAKHIEVGLTDKADSVRWVLRELAAPRGIGTREILIAGDEFGSTAGFPGSDERMVVPEASGAVYVSVGPEPAGVPPPVIHLGGGPRRFRGDPRRPGEAPPGTPSARPHRRPNLGARRGTARAEPRARSGVDLLGGERSPRIARLSGRGKRPVRAGHVRRGCLRLASRLVDAGAGRRTRLGPRRGRNPGSAAIDVPRRHAGAPSCPRHATGRSMARVATPRRGRPDHPHTGPSLRLARRSPFARPINRSHRRELRGRHRGQGVEPLRSRSRPTAPSASHSPRRACSRRRTALRTFR